MEFKIECPDSQTGTRTIVLKLNATIVDTSCSCPVNAGEIIEFKHQGGIVKVDDTTTVYRIRTKSYFDTYEDARIYLNSIANDLYKSRIKHYVRIRKEILPTATEAKRENNGDEDSGINEIREP